MREILKNKLDILVFFIVLVIPVILWFTTPALEPRFSSWENTLPNLGEIFGILGLIILSINIILSTRFSWLEKMLNGLNNLYAKHSKIGQIAFMLVLFHPLLLTFRYATNLAEAREFLWLSKNTERNLGIIALCLMIVLIILTLYLKPKYHIWKWTHKFFGIAFILSGIHAYLIPSYTNNINPILKYYSLMFMLIGLVSFVYRSVLGDVLIKKYRYVVDKIDKNANLIEITLRPEHSPMNFKAGQFVFISFNQIGLPSESHPFSISSGPEEKNLRLTIKNLGDFTEKLQNRLMPGAKVKIEGPFGVFSHTKGLSKNQIWIAGGIGITPFLSMAESLKESQGYQIDLYYSIKNESESFKLSELEEISKSLSKSNSIKIIPVFTEREGYLNAEMIKKKSGDFYNKDFFVCAPPQMIQSLRQQLINFGVQNKFIHSEEFNF